MSLGIATGPAQAAASSGPAPGAPGTASDWVPGDKAGFGTARGTASKVWFTLHAGEMSEIYYPRIDTPSTRDTQLVVTDGRTFTDRESTDTTHEVRLLDPRSLTYRQTDRAKSGKYVITKTYTTDPARSTVLVDIDFRSLTGQPYHVYVLHDPALSMTGDDDTGKTQGGALVAGDGTNSDAVLVSGGFTRTSSGYQGASDGWTDLAADHRMDWTYTADKPGNVVQTGRTSLTGLAGRQHVTLAIGFGSSTTEALSTAKSSLDAGFAPALAHYAAGWHKYLATLAPVPHAARKWATEYHVSQMVLAGSEDKTYRGGFVASPGRPWAWANVLQSLAVYHAVWSRDQYEIATALLAMGDRGAADRALDYLFDVQQRPDGSYPQNSRLSGEAVFGGLQMDEVSFPTVLAAQLGRTGPSDWQHVRKAEDYVVTNGPSTPGERWENASGYSPATIAAEISGLVTGADIARENGDDTRARRYLAVADSWRDSLGKWTVTTTGPYSAKPYFLRITPDGDADAATELQLSDGGPLIDQRKVVDPSFLELVRLGVLAPGDPRIVNSLDVVDRQLGYETPNGPFWHRASFDGYGEKADGSQWEPTDTGSGITHGRGWPLLTGERGEYRLAAGLNARAYLDTMARSRDTSSWLLPEQVWDDQPPSGTGPFQPGTPTFSAMPLAWTHAQFIRLAASIDKRVPVETPQPVACRYASPVCGH
ncbi:glycoside hydrolase family 15 protein [Labedaea rhizosphaerae]|uniref:Glucoamylase n=1 Tax=Labedaea rhizosphaerae TaxID=598644 RepID=A0A4R6S2L9_LABRH|nr:glycoside hydrolase family 15 protein [Labedaea rhizosphaerae]TDP92896.1 glucoamylase [Labedaea rhizosphaerae]